MPVLAKIRALFAPKPLPVAPVPTQADNEFLEAVSRGWRERYRQEPPQLPPPLPPAQDQRAA